MITPKIDLAKWIARIPEHVIALPPESASPIEHYTRGANDSWNLLKYFEAKAEQAGGHKAAYERHAAGLRSLILLALVEAFERFVKELAATCVDQVSKLVLDDRLAVFGNINAAPPLDHAQRRGDHPSDAAKLRLLRRGVVDAPRVLSLTKGDVRYAKKFLDELATWGNERVATRLAELLTDLHKDDPTLFVPAERAAELAKVMRVTVTIAGAAASP